MLVQGQADDGTRVWILSISSIKSQCGSLLIDCLPLSFPVVAYMAAAWAKLRGLAPADGRAPDAVATGPELAPPLPVGAAAAWAKFRGRVLADGLAPDVVAAGPKLAPPLPVGARAAIGLTKKKRDREKGRTNVGVLRHALARARGARAPFLGQRVRAPSDAPVVDTVQGGFSWAAQGWAAVTKIFGEEYMSGIQQPLGPMGNSAETMKV